MNLKPDHSQTNKMLALLAPDGKGLTFQTFSDNADKANKSLIKQYHGEYEAYAEELATLNNHGAGIFVAINKTDGKGRTASNITAVRGLVVDFDTQDAERVQRLTSLKLEPSLIVESSPNKHHAYWLADGIPLDKFKQWQKLLISFFAGMSDIPDTAIHDLPRVMRLAGYYHLKVKAKDGLTGKPFMTRVVYEGKRYELAELEAWLNEIAGKPALPLVEPAKQSKQHQHTPTILPEVPSNNQLPQLTAQRVRDLSRGRWHTILGKLGYTVSSDPKAHTPCPICGGTDRFRFDDIDGKGTYICSQGNGELDPNNDGLSLLADHAGMGIVEAIRAVTSVLNDMGLISSSDAVKVPTASDWLKPEPLRTELSPPTPYPTHAWDGLLYKVVKKIAYYAQVPEAMAGQCVLGALAHIGQAFIDAPMGHSHKPTSLILITEGESGSGKTQAIDISHAVIFDYEKECYKQYLADHEQWTEDMAGLNKAEKEAYKALHPEPHNPEAIFKDATVETILDKYVNEEIINASWTSDDAGQFFLGHSMTGKTAGNALGAFTDLYSGGTVNRSRSQKNAFAYRKTKAYGVRFTLMLMAQRVVLLEALTDPLLNDQGFLPRAMIACPEDLRGQRVWNDPERLKLDPKLDPDFIEYWKRCRELVEPNKMHTSLLNQLLNERIKMQWQDNDTMLYFYDRMQQIEQRMASGKQYEFTKAYASRMAENATRIASLIAYFNKRKTICIDDLRRAFMLVEYSTAERMRYLDITPSDKQNNSEKLSSWLVDKARDKQPHKLTRTYVSNNAPRPMRNAKILQEELDKLESAGHIKQEEETNKRKVIYINPYLFS